MEKIKKNNLPPFQPLIDLICTLRGEKGCPWDKEQTPESIARYLIEEAHELSEAITENKTGDICAELGDVFFQVFFLANIYTESGRFDLTDVVSGIVEKMIRRHPHVFGGHPMENNDDIRAQWHRIKKAEKNDQDQDLKSPLSILDSVPSGLPPLMRAYRVSERAAANGFDWDDLSEVLDKVEEEWAEFKAALGQTVGNVSGHLADKNKNAILLEFGDIIFTLVNVARFSRFHPDAAVTAAVRKFEKRFRWMEHRVAAEGRTLDATERSELERLWLAAKGRE